MKTAKCVHIPVQGMPQVFELDNETPDFQQLNKKIGCGTATIVRIPDGGEHYLWVDDEGLLTQREPNVVAMGLANYPLLVGDVALVIESDESRSDGNHCCDVDQVLIDKLTNKAKVDKLAEAGMILLIKAQMEGV